MVNWLVALNCNWTNTTVGWVTIINSLLETIKVKFNKFKKICYCVAHCTKWKPPSAFSQQRGGNGDNTKTAGTSCVDKEFAPSNVSRSFSTVTGGEKKKKKERKLFLFWGFVASKNWKPLCQSIAPNVIQAGRVIVLTRAVHRSLNSIPCFCSSLQIQPSCPLCLILAVVPHTSHLLPPNN